MKALALHVTRDTPGKKDATGAFIPEAKAFARLHACERVGADFREQVEAALAARRDLEAVAFFCHGLRRELRVGYSTMHRGVERLADAIASATGPHIVMPLYACSTGASDTGFAALLAQALYERGKTGHVDAHTTAAHTTRNPHVRRFELGAARGAWLVEPGSTDWRRWVEALRGDLRFRFPFMTADDVRAEVRKSAPAQRS